MKTLIEKEIRLLLPAFAAALALAIVPVWVLPYDRANPGAFPANLFLLGIVLLALSSFGREIGLKTLPFMLAQPLERARIWWTKIIVLAGCVALASGALGLSWILSQWEDDRLVWPDVLPLIALTVVVLMAGALWMTLLLRQMVAAFWLTLFIPAAAISAIQMLGGKDWMMFTALGLYAVASFFLARHQFLHLQDSAWTGGVLSFGSAPATSETRVLREFRPWAALLRKELHLQQVTLMGMAALLVLHLGVIIVRKVGAPMLGHSILSALEMFGLLWLMVPLLVGGQSVADERQLGTLDGLLCLPFSRRIQFTVKFIVVLVLGGLLSAVLLCAAEGVGSAIGVGSKLWAVGITFAGTELILVVFIFLVLSLIGFYASTLTRSMVSALAAGAVASIAYWMLCRLAAISNYYVGVRLWTAVVQPALAVTVIWLAYGNFRFMFESGLRWRRNIFVWITVLVIANVSVAAVYHRVWELAMPLEGLHGPARLPLGNYPVVGGHYNSSTLSLELPDGRLWQDRIEQQTGQPSGREGHFVPGSNWVDAIALSEETAAIRSDGTLWVSERPQPIEVAGALPPLVQFGVETDWQSVACDSEMVVLLKRDATLWSLETNSATPKTYHGLRTLTPHRLGAESDWARILRGSRWVYAWKQDGTAWHFQAVQPPAQLGSPSKKSHVILDAVTAANRLPELDHTQFQSLNLWPGYVGINLGVRVDGTLWYWDWEGHNVRQIGRESNWAAAMSGYYQLAALKTDGSIWEWNFDPMNRTIVEKLQSAPVQMGKHHDWVGLGALRDETVALAADGTLWLWPKRNLGMAWEDNSGQWLAHSRRPAKIENIFGAPE